MQTPNERSRQAALGMLAVTAILVVIGGAWLYFLNGLPVPDGRQAGLILMLASLALLAGFLRGGRSS